MPRGNFGEHVAKIGRQCQIASFIQLLRCEAGPLAVDLAAVDGAAQREQAASMAVIGATRSVLPDRAPELGHRQNDDVVHPIAKILIKGRDGLAEVLELIRELAPRRTLVGVCVPTTSIGERNLEPDVRFDQLCDLQQALAKR